MTDHVLTSLAWLAAITTAVIYWAGRPKKKASKKAAAKTSGPQAAVIEVVEKGRATDSTSGGSVITPNDVRINGQSLLIPRDAEITVHEITSRDDELVTVTLTLFARRVVIAAEQDLT
ncbi:hypothetical protein [Streptomyces ortus]|uniref:NfeD-like C-terminal domain-containing protein n=1 Tax=Streptomyces ortus TaxID=2867268 RepID=A0ABT3UWU0_9ACTN|nr:hypothetical protein [Streptomyces ortus]MCX4232011.1 hypothetical protein [Streptomyces ortus]